MTLKVTTSPAIPSHAATMDFPSAMRAIIDGHKITKLEWSDERIYCQLRGGWLMIHKLDDWHTWTVSDGDMLGTDWKIIQVVH